MPTTSRLLVAAMLIALGITLQPHRGSAQATPTADDVCAQFLATDEGTPVPDMPDDPDLDPASLEFDLLFLEAMIPHHDVAIQMAQVALERAEHAELQEFADSVISTRQAEVETMRGWREAWYPDAPNLTADQLIAGMTAKLSESPGMGGAAGVEGMGMGHMVADMVDLCGATNEFDLTFIDRMLAHHSSAIVLGQEAANRAVHREVKELAGSIATTQQFEVDQLLTWREQWFAGTPFPEHHD